MMNCYYLKYLLFNWSTPTTPVSTQSPSIPSSPLPCSPQACHVSFWSRWSPCTHQCGTNGTQTRTRTKTIFESCGGSCPHLSEMRSCNRDNCQNSGIPTSSGCSCLPGYNGTCCEIGKLKRNSHSQNICKIYMASSYVARMLKKSSDGFRESCFVPQSSHRRIHLQ